MKLPNGECAVVDRRKPEEYCLSAHHPRGRNEARVFASFGIGQAESDVLRVALFAAARNADAVEDRPSPYGQRYTIDFDFMFAATAKIRSTWIVRKGEDFPRLTTCFAL